MSFSREFFQGFLQGSAAALLVGVFLLLVLYLGRGRRRQEAREAGGRRQRPDHR